MSHPGVRDKNVRWAIGDDCFCGGPDSGGIGQIETMGLQIGGQVDTFPFAGDDLSARIPERGDHPRVDAAPGSGQNNAFSVKSDHLWHFLFT